jgi:hypothetical protein
MALTLEFVVDTKEDPSIEQKMEQGQFDTDLGKDPAF